jgi:hypothetical protein
MASADAEELYSSIVLATSTYLKKGYVIRMKIKHTRMGEDFEIRPRFVERIAFSTVGARSLSGIFA